MSILFCFKENDWVCGLFPHFLLVNFLRLNKLLTKKRIFFLLVQVFSFFFLSFFKIFFNLVLFLSSSFNFKYQIIEKRNFGIENEIKMCPLNLLKESSEKKGKILLLFNAIQFYFIYFLSL